MTARAEFIHAAAAEIALTDREEVLDEFGTPIDEPYAVWIGANANGVLLEGTEAQLKRVRDRLTELFVLAGWEHRTPATDESD